MKINSPNARIIVTKSDMGNYLIEIETKNGFIDFEINQEVAEKLQEALQ